MTKVHSTERCERCGWCLACCECEALKVVHEVAERHLPKLVEIARSAEGPRRD